MLNRKDDESLAKAKSESSLGDLNVDSVKEYNNHMLKYLALTIPMCINDSY
jgi:hypothetical protein